MLANEFGKFIAKTRYDDLPAAVAGTVKLRILDLLAAGLAGYHMGRHRHLLPLLGGAGAATAWGIGSKIAVRDAAMFNSFISHSLYLDDGSRFAGNHPSSVVIPAAVALAETERATGRELIAAVAVGYEVCLRLGRAIYPATVKRGFQSTSVTGAAAAASACASLLRFSPVQAKNAFAIASFMGVGLKEASKSSESQPLQVARSCEGGVLAALFAGQGANGADSIIEGGFLKAFAGAAPSADMVDGLGTDFHIFETYIKMHGGCRGNHAPVDVVQGLVKDHGIKAADIAGVVVQVDTVTYAAEIHVPVSGNQAQFSIAFAVASALIHGDASIFQYTDTQVVDPRMRAMMGKIRVEINKEYDDGYPQLRAASAEITMTDGRRCSGYIDNARGEPEHPFSAAEIENKFLTLAKEILPGGGERVRDTVMKLEMLQDLDVLTSALRVDAPLG